jgi:thymidylate kinase
MGQTIVFIDGAIGVGKSTLVKFLYENLRLSLEEIYAKRKGHGFRLDILGEPLRNSEAEAILRNCDYEQVLKFILERKSAVISNWVWEIAADGLQMLEENVLIVERSFEGDLCVRGKKVQLPEWFSGSAKQIYIMLCSPTSDSGEQDRVSVEYNRLESEVKKDRIVMRATRPASVEGYIAIAHRIAGIILK